MARSPLTLAASVTAVLPHASVVAATPLSEGATGRFDTALVTLDDGQRVVVRAATDESALSEQATEYAALSALTPGVRAQLPFAAPEVLGQTELRPGVAYIETFLDGYRVDAAQIPAGRGVATAIGETLARVHDLPFSVVRDAGLPVRTAEDVRAAAEALLDRAEATGKLPFGLLRRWSTQIGTHDLWQFETTVTLGGAESTSFIFTDRGEEPVVSGVLGWRSLSVGDPALDLRWTTAAPAARLDIADAYAAHSNRAADEHLMERARLHAEFEFAAWLLHGEAIGSEQIVNDAVALLSSLDESVRDEPAFVRATVTADDAFEASKRVPTSDSGAVDTSMHTDAFDADELAQLDAALDAKAGEDAARGDTVGVDLSETPAETAPSTEGHDAEWRARAAALNQETQPFGVTDWVRAESAGAQGDAARGTPAASTDDGSADRDTDIDEAARNALRRWSGSA